MFDPERSRPSPFRRPAARRRRSPLGVRRRRVPRKKNTKKKRFAKACRPAKAKPYIVKFEGVDGSHRYSYEQMADKFQVVNPAAVGHNCMGHNCVGHNCIGRNYIGCQPCRRRRVQAYELVHDREH